MNPAVATSSVAAQTGGLVGMLNNHYNAFNHMDMQMLKPNAIRSAELNANKYAITDTKDTTYLSNDMNSAGAWVRPYVSYDSINLKGGPKLMLVEGMQI